MADQKKVEAGRLKLADYRRKKNSVSSPVKKKASVTDDASVNAEHADLIVQSASTSDGSFVTASSPSIPDVSSTHLSLPSPNSGSTSDGTYVTVSNDNESMSLTIGDHTRLNRLTGRVRELEEIVAGKDAELVALRDHISSASYRDFSVSVGELSVGLEADYKKSLEKYQNRLEEFEVAVKERDKLITQLSERLKLERTSHATKELHLAQEVALLQNQLHATTQLVQGHTWDTGIDPHDYLILQNKMIAMDAAAKQNLVEISKLHAAIQTKEEALLNKSEELTKNKTNAAIEVQELMRQVESLNQRSSPRTTSNNLTLDETTMYSLEEEFGLRMCDMKEELRKQLKTEHSSELICLHEQLASLKQQCDDARCVEDKLTSELASYQVELALNKEQISQLNNQLSAATDELQASQKEAKAQVEKSKRDIRKFHENESVSLRDKNERLEVDLETLRAELDACKEAFIAQWGPNKQSRESELVELRHQVTVMNEATRAAAKQCELEQERHTLHEDQVKALNETIQQLTLQLTEENTQSVELEARLQEAIAGYELKISGMIEERSALEEKYKLDLSAMIAETVRDVEVKFNHTVEEMDQERKNLEERYELRIESMVRDRAALDEELRQVTQTLVKERTDVEEQYRCENEKLVKERAAVEEECKFKIETMIQEKTDIRKQFDEEYKVTLQPTLQQFNLELQELRYALSKEQLPNPVNDSADTSVVVPETENSVVSPDEAFVCLMLSQLSDAMSVMKAMQYNISNQEKLNFIANTAKDTLADELRTHIKDLEMELAEMTNEWLKLKQEIEDCKTHNTQLESLLLGANLASEALKETCEEKQRVEETLTARIAALEATVREVQEDSLTMKNDSECMTKQVAKARELLKRMKADQNKLIEQHELELSDLRSKLLEARTDNKSTLEMLSGQLADFEEKHGELFARCQLYETEVIQLRSQLALSESSLEDLRNQSPRAPVVSEPTVLRQKDFAAGDSPAIFDGSLFFNNTNNNSTFNSSEYFTVAGQNSDKPFTTPSELQARLEQLHTQLQEKQQLEHNLRVTQAQLEERLREKEHNEEELKASQLQLVARLESLQAQAHRENNSLLHNLELENKDLRGQLDHTGKMQIECERKLAVVETELRDSQEAQERLRQDLHAISSEAGFEDIILELESLAKEKVSLAELLRCSEQREKQLRTQLVETELESEMSRISRDSTPKNVEVGSCDMEVLRRTQLRDRVKEVDLSHQSAISAEQPSEWEERLRKLHTQLDTVHRGSVSRLRLRAQQTSSLREAELRTEFCTQLADTNKQHLNMVGEEMYLQSDTKNVSQDFFFIISER